MSMHTTINGQSGCLLFAPGIRTHCVALSVDAWRDGKLVVIPGARMAAALILSCHRDGTPAPAAATFSLS